MEPKIVWLFVFVILYWGYCIFWGIKGAIAAKTASWCTVKEPQGFYLMY